MYMIVWVDTGPKRPLRAAGQLTLVLNALTMRFGTALERHGPIPAWLAGLRLHRPLITAFYTLRLVVQQPPLLG